MKKKVRIAALKARLSAHLRYVRAGKEIVVLDRNTPIARILPYPNGAAQLAIRPARGRLSQVVLESLPPSGAVDSLATLRDLRRERS